MLFIIMVCLIVGLASCIPTIPVILIPLCNGRIERNFPCQTLKISKVSLVVMGS
jgi:hypothetical protein